MIAALGRALAPFGFDLVGVTTPAAYDALVPPSHRLGSTRLARSIVVIGNGGGAFWSAYRRHCAAEPAYAARAHPLDAFTTTVMETHALPAIAHLGAAPVVRFPFDVAAPALSFVHLAEAAGLGCRSLLGVLVHPEYGPWMALRAALLVDADLEATRPAAGFDPCPTCVDRPCITACPADAITPAEGWNVPRCVDFRTTAETNPCETRCHARVACVYGRHHRYPDDALAYHQGRAFAVMRKRQKAF